MALTDTVAQIAADLSTARQILHGSNTQTVTTDNGSLKTVAKEINGNDVLASTSEASRVSAYNSGKTARSNDYTTRQAQLGVQSGSALNAVGIAAALAATANQDLSAVALPLHRSPNAVTAMFVYDTSKDSDGGAWTQKCEATSWFQEALTGGSWLSSQPIELYARATGCSVGAEGLTDPGFDNPAAWTSNWMTVSGGQATRVNNSNAGSVTATFNAVVNTLYRVQVTLAANQPSFSAVTNTNVGSVSVQMQVSGQGVNVISPVQWGMPGQTLTFYLQPTVATTIVTINSSVNTYTNFESVSVKPVTAFNTKSGDYYQLTTDGKFYRLWKNLLSSSEAFTNASYWTQGTVIVTDGAATYNGVSLSKLVPTAANNGHYMQNTGASLPSVMNGQQVTVSGLFQTGGGYNSLRVGILNGIGVRFDFSAQTFTVEAGAATGAFTNLGGGVFSWSMTLTIPSTGTTLYVGVANGAITSFAGDGVSGIYVGGLQLELGATATAYEKKVADSTQTEVFRGSQARPPRVWGIVAELRNVTIYALDQPNCPMWMRFNGPGVGVGIIAWTSAGANVPSVAAREGRLFIGSAANSNVYLDFVKDQFQIVHAGSYRLVGAKNIADRNNVVTYISDSASTMCLILTNVTVSSVSMCTMPDAPVDPMTGLQVPTVAVGATGGGGLIKHDGTTVNLTMPPVASLYLNPYVLLVDRQGTAVSYVLTQPGQATNTTPFVLIGNGSAPDFSLGSVAVGRNAIAGRSLFISPRVTPSSVELLKFNETTPASSLAARITNTYNTGWLVGDIKRAYLSDTTMGYVGDDVITNPNDRTFAIDTGFWTKDVGVAFVGGAVSFNGVTTGLGINRTTLVTNSHTYLVTYTITSISSGGFTFKLNGVLGTTRTAPGTYSEYVTSGVGSFSGIVTVGTTTGTIDNISIKDPVADRSYKSKFLAPYGSLSRFPVNNNAQLVGYSGFSAANYLQELTYSSDLDPSTGSLSITAWGSIPVVLPTANFPLVGSQLLADTGFDDATKWSLSGGVTIGSSRCTFAGVANNNGAVSVGNSVITLGKTYLISFTVVSITAGGFKPSVGGTLGVTVATTPGTYTEIVQASSSGVGAILASGTTSGVIDNVTVQQAGPCWAVDRGYSSGPYYRIGVDGVGRLVGEIFDGTTTQRVTTTADYNLATFIKCRMEYVPNGASSTLTLKVNGAQVVQNTIPALLSLNARWNKLNNTERFDLWTLTNASAAPNFGVSPTGTTTSTRITFNGGGLSSNVTQVPSISTIGGQNGTLRVYAKMGTSRYIQLLCNGDAAVFLNVDLQSGVLGTAGAKVTGQSIASVGNGWYLITMSHTSTAAADARVYGGNGASDAYSPLLTVGGTIELWGADYRTADTSSNLTYQRVGVVGSTDFDFASVLTIGNNYGLNAAFPGTLALVRVSLTVPTVEQSAFMYAQESEMFADGAQITLPDNNPPVDLEYDPAQDKWKVVTITNESSFVGLVRTSYTTATMGNIRWVCHRSGFKLIGRSSNPGADIFIPAQGFREELSNRSEAAARTTRLSKTFDFDATTGQTDFVLPLGWEAMEVVSAGVGKREGATKDWIRLWDGFKETIRFAVAPGSGTWVQVVGRQILNQA